MFWQRQSYFVQLSRSYPILKLFDIYDRQSFIRAYVLDNVYVCILVHILFYAALWFATTVIKKMETWNREMLSIMEQKRTGLQDAVALKDKNTEYDEVVVKVKEGQKATTVQLENEMHRLSTELIAAAEKLSELEEIIQKYKWSGKPFDSPAGDVADRKAKGKLQEGAKGGMSSLEDLKILEPSFPPALPPPRKYGIFVTRPPGHRRPPPTAANATPPPKLGFNTRSSADRKSMEQGGNKIIWNSGDRRDEDKRRRRRGKSLNSAIMMRSDFKKLQTEPLKTVTPFTKALLGLATIFPKEMY